MTLALSPQLTSVINNDKYLASPKDRFQFGLGNKRTDKGGWEVDSNEKCASFEYMLDRSTGEVYSSYDPEHLKIAFAVTFIAVPLVYIASIPIYIGMIAADILSIALRVLKESDKNSFMSNLSKQTPAMKEVFQTRFTKFKKVGYYALALERASFHAFFHRNDEPLLHAMQVIIARIEFLWNNEVSHKETAFYQLAQISNQTKSWKAFFREVKDRNWELCKPTFYVMPFFQPVGEQNDQVEGERKFRFIEKSMKPTYKEFQSARLEFVKKAAHKSADSAV